MEFHEFLEKEQDSILTRILLSARLLEPATLRQAIIEKNQTQENFPLAQFLIRQRYLKMSDYSKIMVEVRKEAEKIYQEQGGKIVEEETMRYHTSSQNNTNSSSEQLQEISLANISKAPANKKNVLGTSNAKKNITETQSTGATQTTNRKTNPPTIKKSVSASTTTVTKAESVPVSSNNFATQEENQENIQSAGLQLKDLQSNHPVQGARLGAYEILEEIARGGMGIVYRARQIYMNRIVALKVLLAGGSAKESEIKRFRQEAESAGSLQHPNIVSIYEVGEQNGIHYFTMDFVEGDTLQILMKKRGTRIKNFVKILIKVADALEHAHQHNVIHRDIKPANIIVSEEGEPKLMDFGLAKKQDVGEALTEKGSTLGTPYYMAPEQIMNKETDCRADIYSMGVILYEILAHRLPFSATTLAELYHKVMDEDPIFPNKFNRKVDDNIMAICLKAMSKKPENRYNSAKELCEDLERYLNDEPVEAQLPNMIHIFSNKIKKMGAKAWITFGLIFLLLSSGIIVLLQYWIANPQIQKKIELDALILEGNGLLKEKKWPQALAKFKEALQRNAKCKEAYLGCGDANLQSKKIQEAILQYNEAIRIDDKMLDAYLGRGKAFQEQKEWDKAIKDLNWIVQNSTKDLQSNFKLLETYYTLGQVYEQKKIGDSINKAFESYQKGEEIKKYILMEAEKYIKSFQFNQALECYTAILKVIPNDNAALNGWQKTKSFISEQK